MRWISCRLCYRWLLISISLSATIFGQSTAQHEIRCFFIEPSSALRNKFFSTYCIVFLKLRSRDIVAFRSKNCTDDKLAIDSLQTANLTFAVATWKSIVSSFSTPLWCNKHLPGPSAIYCFEFFGMFVSTCRLRIPGVFSVRDSGACFQNNYVLFDLQVFFYDQMAVVKNTSIAFRLKQFVIDSK